MSQGKKRSVRSVSTQASGPTGRKKVKKAAQERRQAKGIGIWLVAVPLLVVALAGIGIWIAMTAGNAGQSPAQSPAQSFAIQGRQHVATGESHPPYNSNPPTSGWHYEQSATWGVHDSQLPDEQLVHNLEHGGVWISYQPSLDVQAIDRLREITRKYRSKVILTPRAKDDSKIALAAWGKLDTLDTFDEARILAFINAFYDKGPEKVAD